MTGGKTGFGSLIGHFRDSCMFEIKKNIVQRVLPRMKIIIALKINITLSIHELLIIN